MKRFHVSKNMWGEPTETDYYINSSGEIVLATNGDLFLQKGITVSPLTTYSFSWSEAVQGSADNYPYIRICYYTAYNGEFINRELLWAGDYPNKQAPFFCPANCTYIDVRIDSPNSSRGQHYDNIMLNTGATALPYEPYGDTWQTKNPPRYGTATDVITSLPVDIYTDGQTIGVNLFDLTGIGIENGTFNPSTGATSPNDKRCRTANYITLSAGTYTLATNPAIRYVLYVYDTNVTYIQAESITAWVDNKLTFTLTETRKVKFGFSKTNDPVITPSEVQNIMLNIGSTALPYQPYTPTIIKGNMVQTGTPTSTTPTTPSECGERTAQLYFKKIASGSIGADGSIVGNASFDCYVAKVAANQQYIGTGYVYAFYTSEPTLGSTSYNGQRSVESATNGFTSPINGYVAVRHNAGVTDARLNTGSAILPYEPYGYVLPIKSGNTTTPVYLGEVQSTRRIKKVVFNGTENWQGTDDTASKYLQNNISDYKIVSGVTCMSTHYSGANNVLSGDTIPNNSVCFNIDPALYVIYLKGSEPITLADFKTYLAQQYAAGTPVTVWYVLANETTGIVNEPLRKIGDYADTVSVTNIPTTAGGIEFDVDTTLKPSEVDLTYHGWHDASVKEKSRNLFDKSVTPYSTTGFITREGALTEYAGYSVSNYVEISSNTEYTLSGMNTSAVYAAICFYTNDKTYISGLRYDGATELTFTTPANCKYVLISYVKTKIDTVMLNTGSTALPYEPYWK